MRLLHTSTLQFKEFFDQQTPEYAILSHRWGTIDQKVSYSEMCARQKRNTAGFTKIRMFCQSVVALGYSWCWIDTCCIDKTSSAELTEAINSMFKWYASAEICLVYLNDVTSLDDLHASQWFTRGWTLEELLAPHQPLFLKQDWDKLDSTESLQDAIAGITTIPRMVLSHRAEHRMLRGAQIMSLAARRTTTRVEDQAYCLLGLFEVNMPLLYGEGTKAFRRLQEAIVSQHADLSLFAWGRTEYQPSRGDEAADAPPMLAISPKQFAGCGAVMHRPVRMLDLEVQIAPGHVSFLFRRRASSHGLQRCVEALLEFHSTTLVWNASDAAYAGLTESLQPPKIMVPLDCTVGNPELPFFGQDAGSGNQAIFLHLVWSSYWGKWCCMRTNLHPISRLGRPPSSTTRLKYTSDEYHTWE